MAALDMGGFFVRFLRTQKPKVKYGTTNAVSDFAAKQYAKTSGPTPELRKLYRDYLANQRQRTATKR